MAPRCPRKIETPRAGRTSVAPRRRQLKAMSTRKEDASAMSSCRRMAFETIVSWNHIASRPPLNRQPDAKYLLFVDYEYTRGDVKNGSFRLRLRASERIKIPHDRSASTFPLRDQRW